MSTKVITGKVRFSYANVWEPKSVNGSDPKYSVSLIIPKNDTKKMCTRDRIIPSPHFITIFVKHSITPPLIPAIQGGYRVPWLRFEVC